MKLIDLKGIKPFATGGNRRCYVHPENPHLCLKVSRKEVILERYSKLPWPKKILGKGRLDDNFQEMKGYKQLEKIPNSKFVFDHIPRLFERVETSEGWANVSELIKGRDGEIAHNLSQWLALFGMDQRIKLAIEEFQKWLLDNQILTRNLLPHNLAVQESSEGLRLYIIDGLGAADFLSLLYPIKGWRMSYIQRKVRNMNLRIQWELSGRQGQWRERQKEIIKNSKKIN